MASKGVAARRIKRCGHGLGQPQEQQVRQPPRRDRDQPPYELSEPVPASSITSGPRHCRGRSVCRNEALPQAWAERPGTRNDRLRKRDRITAQARRQSLVTIRVNEAQRKPGPEPPGTRGDRTTQHEGTQRSGVRQSLVTTQSRPASTDLHLFNKDHA